ncbi:MAG: hypothetical protein Q9182_006325 [Xanthomendoza sp. 2 TL-2023]
MASEIVVGIDFGTTHSGASWAVNGGTKHVRLINDWPNPNSSVANAEKVPTIISYQNERPHNWGYNVELTEQSFKWFKILLDPTHAINKNVEPVVTSSKLLGVLHKTAEEIAADYFRLLWQYIKDDIQRVKGDNWKSIYTLKVVLTVPAIWSATAKERTLNAARAAGLSDNLMLVTEPEAAALAVLKDRNEEDEPLEAGDAFTDLISYKVKDINPLQLEECAVGDGGLCGSVFLDAAFEKYVETIVGKEQYSRIKLKSRKKMLREFEMSVKRCYTGDDKEYSVDLQGVEDNPEQGIDDDTIRLKPSMLKTVFDHVINQINNLVDNQIEEVAEQDLQVKAILLVGGFGASKYMHQRLKDAHQGDGIQVLQVNGAGATMWGLENSGRNTASVKTVAARVARHNYGICVSWPFDLTKGHLLVDRYRGTRGEWRASNQMSWLLRKGERIEEGRVLRQQLAHSIQVGFLDVGMRYFTQTVQYCPNDTAPRRKEHSESKLGSVKAFRSSIDPRAAVKELCTVTYGIDCNTLWMESSYKDPVTKQKWRDATFDLEIRLDSAMLHFTVSYRGNQVAYTQADYNDES